MILSKASARWFIPFLLFGPICVFHRKILLSQQLPDGGDMLNQFIPWRRFALDCLAGAHLPLWNPYVFCGTPFWANIQTALLFPWNMLHLILDVPLFFAFCLVIHHLIAAGSMYLFFRNRWRDRLPALVAATVYAWSGFFILHANDGHLIHIQAYAYIPLCLLAQDRLRLGFTWLRLTGFAAPLAMMILAGHLQLPLYVFYFLILRALWHVIFQVPDQERLAERIKPALWNVAGIALALLLCGAILLPLLELSGYSSTRAGGTDYQFATHDSLPPAHLPTLLAPFLYGDPTRPEPDQKFWETITGYHEICGYAGVVSLVLAFLSFVPLPSRGVNGAAAIDDRDTAIQRRFALCLLVVALVLALGGNTPFYRIPYHLFPGFAYFRVPGRLVLFYGFAVALLAGLGMRRLSRASWWEQRQRISVLLLLGTGCLLILVCILALSYRNSVWAFLHHVEIERSRQALGLPDRPDAYEAVAARIPKNLTDGRLSALLNGIFIATGLFWLGLFGAGLADRWRERVPQLTVLLWVLVLGDLLWFSHRFISTFPRDEWVERYYRETDLFKLLQQDRQSYRVLFTDEIVIGRGIPNHQESIHNRPMQVGVKAVRGYDPIQLASFASFVNTIQGRDPSTPQGGMLYIRHPRNIQPRGYELTAVKYVVTTEDVPDSFELVWADPYSPLRMYLNPDARPEVQLLDDPSGKVELLAERPGLLEARVRSSQGARLVWSQCWYPGWRVTLDGEQREVDLLEEVFMQVPVLPGQHIVRFAFHPTIVYWGFAVSVLTFAILVVLCLRERWGGAR